MIPIDIYLVIQYIYIYTCPFSGQFWYYDTIILKSSRRHNSLSARAGWASKTFWIVDCHVGEARNLNHKTWLNYPTCLSRLIVLYLITFMKLWVFFLLLLSLSLFHFTKNFNTWAGCVGDVYMQYSVLVTSPTWHNSIICVCVCYLKKILYRFIPFLSWTSNKTKTF